LIPLIIFHSKSRGSLLIWLDPTMGWHGRPSDQAIQFCRF